MKRVYPVEDVCMGCGLCEVACATEHSESRNTIKAYKEEEIVPRNNVDRNSNLAFSINCRHCEEPSCVEACITGAIDIDRKNNLVLIDKDRCVACWSCIMACPFGTIKRDLKNNVSTKCDLCKDRAEGPGCVQACPNRALVYEER
jgi:carbon-monoxide dehydrogenase iron sulfur subunit